MTGVTLPRSSRVAWAKAAAPFGHRNYRLFFGGQAISLVGTWMQQVAQGWLVLTLTGDPFWLGVVASAQFLPVMILGLFAGVLADVLPKRQTLIAVQVDDDGARGDPRRADRHRRRPGLDDRRARGPARLCQRRRHAGPSVVRDRDGRAARHRQRRRDQLGDVQRRSRGGAGRRRADDRGVRHGPGVRDQRR